METKRRFKITITYDEITETTLWSGKCSYEDVDVKFHEAIKEQMIKYKINPQRCMLRAYDEFGRIIAQETFHGVG
jgi:C4-type Zn-finger protein